ncbi:GGDEF domain-containing protein [Actinocrispum wychmicini]|uniref:PAS domain S-box-containing protein/diguanylate cyclase (GGDEF)-like protein n=1 Tax=Actinocrispum wychmicini TaxID=1213861 RepID=A0A4R2IN95_9PSEU|nr:GGDEF domain-containing protein [Actinocrispum wychmicini]TCO46534.1 PAS domain S-box-containing protein/diguanylate cyclase (GGDEF)-like protein [Actinocrispum wychmicini]
MIAPRPEDPAPAGGSRQRERLVRRWASLVTSTSHVPLPPAEFEQRLADMLDDLVDIVRSDPRLAVDCGAELVEAGCTDPVSIQSTMDALGPGLLTLPELRPTDRLADKVVQTLGAMAAGYAAELRRLTFAQQETMSVVLRRTLAEVQRNLRTVTTQFDHVVAGSASGVALTDQHGHVLRANRKLADILGYPETELAGLTVFDVLPDLLTGRKNQTVVRKDGETTQVTLRSLESVGDQWVIILEDRSELDLLHGQLTHQALHDMVTRLPNRQYFTSTLESTLTRTALAVYHLDLDGFKNVTHGLGRESGDHLLNLTAHRLTTVVADAKAMVARFHADEFALLLENPPDPHEMAARIAAELNEISACIGIVHRPQRHTTATDVLASAELALARAKRFGPGQWSLANPLEDAKDREAFRRALP